MENHKWNTQMKANTRLLAIWTAAWTLSMAMASLGPTLIWGEHKVLTITAIMLNAALGVGMILANIRHLNGLDEMQRKVQLEAMGIALGVGVVGGLSYSLLDATNVIPGDAEISYLVILIGLTYFAATVIGLNRYR